MPKYTSTELTEQWNALKPVFSARPAELTETQRALVLGADFDEVRCAFNLHLDLRDKRHSKSRSMDLPTLLNTFTEFCEQYPDADIRLNRHGKPLTPETNKFAERSRKSGLDSRWAVFTVAQMLEHGLDGSINSCLSAGVGKRLSDVIRHCPPS